MCRGADQYHGFHPGWLLCCHVQQCHGAAGKANGASALDSDGIEQCPQVCRRLTMRECLCVRRAAVTRQVNDDEPVVRREGVTVRFPDL
jgi:hypothetical protein